jgi:hypothetical protein
VLPVDLGLLALRWGRMAELTSFLGADHVTAFDPQ